MKKYKRIKETNIKDRKIAFTSKKGKFIAKFNNLEEAAEFLIKNNIASGTISTVTKNLYGMANGNVKSGYRFLILIEGINGITEEYIENIAFQKEVG